MPESFARGRDSGVNVGSVAFGDFGEGVSGGRIAVGGIGGCGRDPRAADEFIEAAMVPLEPLIGLFGVFRRDSVLHGVELFGDAHHKSL